MGSKSGSGSGSGSGSSSGGSGGTARPNASQTAQESITFTFSSRNSPFVHLAPPGSVTFVSKTRRGSDFSRDRSHRKQQGSQSSLGPGWITLKPMTDSSPPLFDSPKSEHAPHAQNVATKTAVFSSRAAPKARQLPRLSLVAQHHHATSPHPVFNTPPQLVTPPPLDPFSQLRRPDLDSYFPPMAPSRSGDHSLSHKTSSKSSTRSHRTKLEQPQPTHPLPRTSSSRTPNTNTAGEFGTSQSTPRVLSRADPGPAIRSKDSALIPIARASSTCTPTQRQVRSRKSITPPRLQPQSRPQSQPQSQVQAQVQAQVQPQSSASRPSIDAFRDCFGVLTRIENVFPTRSQLRSGSGGSENLNVMGSGPSLTEFQRRWTRRWIRRTMRGVGSMSSGSTSSGSAGTGFRSGGEGAGSSVADTMIFLGLGGDGQQQATGGSAGSGSQDSLDRVRVSRSNAPSPSTSSSGGSSVAAAIAARLSGERKFKTAEARMKRLETESVQQVAA